MGRGRADLPASVTRAYRIVDGDGMVKFETRSGPKTPVEVSAEILGVLRERAERELGGELEGAVITVPAYFDEAQREATRDAARLAGLKVLRLLSEPTAAAVAYGLDRATAGTYAVYDLGGGTFDISILKLTRGVFEVIATNGNAVLGGDDFDARIADWLAGLTSGADADFSPSNTRELLNAARCAKEALSEEHQVAITVPLPGGRKVEATLTRAQLETLTADLVNMTLVPVRRALRDANFGAGCSRRRSIGRRGDADATGAARGCQVFRAPAAYRHRSRRGGCDWRRDSGRCTCR